MVSGVEHDVGEGAADADEPVALLQLLVGDREGEVLVDLTFQTSLHARRARTASAVVGEAQPGVLGLLEDVLVLGDVYRDAASLEGDLVRLRHVCSRRTMLAVVCSPARSSIPVGRFWRDKPLET